MHAARAAGKLVLAGTILDDTERPIGHAHVSVSIEREGNPFVFSSAGIANAMPESCGEGRARTVLERAERLALLQSMMRDAFCVRLALLIDRYVAKVEAMMPLLPVLIALLVDPAWLDLALDLARETVTLRFDPPEHVLSLDEESATLEAMASTSKTME